ncbi:hypothetical protein AB0395_33300 [Streptosporangium sp. NPDC051023]|uniref:hypothetical protein n=1 Tax=Streptosporangium sp. NPDC051023 TaxID=3155410 RepID=UPI00344B16DD
MIDPYTDHDGHGTVTLSLTEQRPDGGLVYQSWRVCDCIAPAIRAQLGTPHHEATADRTQVEATGRAVLRTDSGIHIMEGR